MKGTLLIGRGVKRTWAAAVGFSSGDRPKGPPFVLNALGLPLGDFTKINKTVKSTGDDGGAKAAGGGGRAYADARGTCGGRLYILVNDVCCCHRIHQSIPCLESLEL